jgi:hypothetical protein
MHKEGEAAGFFDCNCAGADPVSREASSTGRESGRKEKLQVLVVIVNSTQLAGEGSSTGSESSRKDAQGRRSSLWL